MVHEIFSFTGNKRIALIFPAGESAEHHFHRPPQLGQLQRGNVSAVAVRPGAVDHKEGLRRPGRHSLGGDLAVREMLRAWQVTSGEGFLTADHVQQDKVDLAARWALCTSAQSVSRCSLWLNQRIASAEVAGGNWVTTLMASSPCL